MLPELFVIHRRQLRQKPSNCLFSCKSGLRHSDYESASLRAGPFTLCSPKESSKLFRAKWPRTSAKEVRIEGHFAVFAQRNPRDRITLSSPHSLCNQQFIENRRHILQREFTKSIFDCILATSHFSRKSGTRLKAEISGRIVREDSPDSNIFPQHDRGLVAALVHECPTSD